MRDAARTPADDENFFDHFAFQTLVQNAFADHPGRARDDRPDFSASFDVHLLITKAYRA
jgi:hypothetical protein